MGLRLVSWGIVCLVVWSGIRLAAQEKTAEPSPTPRLPAASQNDAGEESSQAGRQNAPPQPPVPPDDEKPSPNAPSAEPQHESPDGPDARRDPFSTTRTMRERAQRMEPEAGTARRSLPLPELKLRGLISDGTQDPIALLEVDGQDTVVVRPGGTLHVSSRSRAVEVRVENITADAVLVEIGDTGRMFSVR